VAFGREIQHTFLVDIEQSVKMCIGYLPSVKISIALFKSAD